MVVFINCCFFCAENTHAYGHDHRNESGNKYRESFMDNKDGKTCDGDE